MADNNSSKTITVLAVFVFIISLFSVGVFYLSAKTLFSTISGYASSVGEANLSVETTVIINFTTAHINWGSGRVNSGASSATLDTSAGTVTNGNWTVQSNGLVLENIGNVNVTLNLSGTKTAAQMIGGTTPIYYWTFSEAEAGSCLNSTGGTTLWWTPGSWTDVNTTTTNICGRFRFGDSQDTFRIDFQLVVPSDSLIGARGDTITATAFAA